MKRMYINSKIDMVCNRQFLIKNTNELAPTNEYNMQINDFIIQAEQVGDIILVEHCANDQVTELIKFDALSGIIKPVEPKQNDAEKIAEYRDVVLKNDPFQKYSGKKLGEIMDANDDKWVDLCLKNMKNEYIRERIKFLWEHRNADDGLPF